MTSFRTRTLLGVTVLVVSAGCYDDIKVVQGTVVGQDRQAHTLSVRDERPPNAVLPYQLADAPSVTPGEVVRLAFRQQGDSRIVVRMMNVTRATTRKK